MYWYCLSLFWSPLEVSGAARGHLRVFAALKSLVFVFSALQLRSGYPPPASYQYELLQIQSTSPLNWKACCSYMLACQPGRHDRCCHESSGVAGVGILLCSPEAPA